MMLNKLMTGHGVDSTAPADGPHVQDSRRHAAGFRKCQGVNLRGSQWDDAFSITAS
jgi:hypothetical protein